MSKECIDIDSWNGQWYTFRLNVFENSNKYDMNSDLKRVIKLHPQMKTLSLGFGGKKQSSTIGEEEKKSLGHLNDHKGSVGPRSWRLIFRQAFVSMVWTFFFSRRIISQKKMLQPFSEREGKGGRLPSKGPTIFFSFSLLVCSGETERERKIFSLSTAVVVISSLSLSLSLSSPLSLSLFCSLWVFWTV